MEYKPLINNRSFQHPFRMIPTGIMIHSIGINQPNKNIIFNNMNKDVSVSVHDIVDDKGIINCMPHSYRAWHCGGSGNKYLISIEMTEPKSFRYQNNRLIDYDYNDSYSHLRKVLFNLVPYVAELIKKYNLSIDSITTHADGYKSGIASNHCDPYHWWSIHNYTLDKFKMEVLNYMNNTRYNYIKDVPDWMQEYIVRWIDKKIINVKDGELNLTYDMIRILIIVERMINNGI